MSRTKIFLIVAPMCVAYVAAIVGLAFWSRQYEVMAALFALNALWALKWPGWYRKA